MEAIERACADLATAPGADASAQVRIVPVDRDLSVEVTLADGRSASRRLATAESLRPTLEALLLVPTLAPAPRARATEESAPPRELVFTRAEDPGLGKPAPAAPAASPAEPTFGVDIGGAVGGRVAGDSYLSVAPAAFAELRVGPWLVGTFLRWDVYQDKSAPLVTTFEMETVAAGLLVGHRTPLGFGNVDVGVSPRLVVETQTYETKAGEHTATSGTDVRLGAFGRLGLGKGTLRGFLELDAEISPGRVRRITRLDPLLPALPAWSAGLSLGLMWASP
jgi:hypothetical protein